MSKSVDAEVDAAAKEEMQRRLTTLVDCIDVERCNSMPFLEQSCISWKSFQICTVKHQAQAQTR